MNRSTPGLPVHHQLPEFTETHVHWVSDAIQPSHPLSSPSPYVPNPSQHQSLFQLVKLYSCQEKVDFYIHGKNILKKLEYIFSSKIAYFYFSSSIFFLFQNVFYKPVIRHQEHIYYIFLYDVAYMIVWCITTNYGKFFKRWEYQTTWPASWEILYAGQAATVRTEHGTTNWFQIGKGVCQGCILSPCIFNLYAEYIMWNAGLDETQAGIKIAGRNINNLRYSDDTTLMAESEEELKSLLMKMKEKSEKVGLRLSIQKTKIMASGPITSWQIDRETMEKMTNLFRGAPKITAECECCHEINRHLLLGRKVMTNLDSILKPMTLHCQQRSV